MEHLAYMNKSWGMLPRLLSGQKTIESRWYMTRTAPWNRVQAGETIYFKQSGGLVRARATVERVLQFDDLTSQKVGEILAEYGARIGITPDELPTYFKRFQHKRYCILVFLSDVTPIEPFAVDKSGYGNASAWICADSIAALRI